MSSHPAVTRAARAIDDLITDGYSPDIPAIIERETHYSELVAAAKDIDAWFREIGLSGDEVETMRSLLTKLEVKP